jgi:hypothetical protein
LVGQFDGCVAASFRRRAGMRCATLDV